MKQIYIIVCYELIKFWRNRAMVLSLLFFFLLSIFSLYYGKNFVSEQEKVIAPIAALAHQRTLAGRDLFVQYQDSMFTKQKERQIYRALDSRGTTAIYRPSAFSSFSIGQKDNYPYYTDVGIRGNVYDMEVSEIQNPDKLQAGNFDLSFIFIYLAPLFVIAMGYNTLSGEVENQTIRLLHMQVSTNKIVWGKLLFLFLLLAITATLVTLIGFYINGMNFRDHSTQLLVWLLISYSYFLFWIFIVAFVISLKTNSSINALILGSTWIVSLLLAPTIVHREVSSSQDKRLVDLLLYGRGDGGSVRKIPIPQLIDSVYLISHPYPLHVDSTTAEEKLRYIGMNEVRARRNNTVGRNITNAQQQEYLRAQSWNIINPGYAVQNAYNRVAETELENYHNYLRAAEDYQTRKRYMIYNYRLDSQGVTLADYEAFPVFNYIQPLFTFKACLIALRPLYLLSFLLCLGSILIMRKREYA